MKTLKDFETMDNMVYKDLRQSAIEDIKEYKRITNGKIKLNRRWYLTLIGKIEYIKEKFNLTEEDLK